MGRQSDARTSGGNGRCGDCSWTESAAGKTIEVRSSADLPKKDLPCEWRLAVGDNKNALAYRVTGFEELAHDVLEIAKVMAKKPLRPGEFYDLDGIWDDLESQVF